MDVAERKRRFFDTMDKLIRMKDLLIQKLLLQIDSVYPGSHAEKLRAEAQNEHKINSIDDYNFGITGQSGVGKSSLINAICGFDDNHPEAAEVHIRECTEEVARYSHPYLKHLALYDLPGAGTTRNPISTYFCDKRLYVFDCLLLVTSERIRENDLALAKLAEEMGTPVIFVRNKAKNDFETMKNKLSNQTKSKTEVANETISTIKEYFMKELEIAEIKDPKIFVIEAHSLRQLGNLSPGEIHKVKDILYFEELALFQYITELVSARSRFPIKEKKLHKTKKIKGENTARMNDSYASPRGASFR